jgi:hypothetical protein
MATCEPTLFLFAAKEILLAHFIIKNFQNVVYTLAAKFFDDVGIVLPRPKRPRRQFSSGYVKVRFHSLDVLWRTKHFCRHFLSLNVKLVTAKIKFFGRHTIPAKKFRPPISCYFTKIGCGLTFTVIMIDICKLKFEIYYCHP